MTVCPQCEEEMDLDFVDDALSKLELDMTANAQRTHTYVEEATCCGKKVKFINEVNSYYIISEPPRIDEERRFIAGK